MEPLPAAEPFGSVGLSSDLADALHGLAGAPDAEPERAEPLWPACVAAESWEAEVVSRGGAATGVPADPPVPALWLAWLALSAGAALALPDPPLSIAGAPLSPVGAGAADESGAGAVFCESVAELCDSPAAGAEVRESAVAVLPWPLDGEVPATPLAAAAAPEPRCW